MNLKRHHVLYIVIALSLSIGVALLLMPTRTSVSFIPTQNVTDGVATASSTSPKVDTRLDFEVVTSAAEQELGLGGRTSIPENYGMLFVFDHNFRVGFWMKDMRVPIDIVWLSDNGTVLGIEDSISPDSYPRSVYPPQPVKYVLETKAGEMRRRGWGIGTHIALPLPYGV